MTEASDVEGCTTAARHIQGARCSVIGTRVSISRSSLEGEKVEKMSSKWCRMVEAEKMYLYLEFDELPASATLNLQRTGTSLGNCQLK